LKNLLPKLCILSTYGSIDRHFSFYNYFSHTGFFSRIVTRTCLKNTFPSLPRRKLPGLRGVAPEPQMASAPRRRSREAGTTAQRAFVSGPRTVKMVLP
jgi:hypothetical protein